MSKHINIIARTNGVGLDSDVIILTKALENAGYRVSFNHCRARSFFRGRFRKWPKYDVNLFLERIFPSWIPVAKTNLLIPNQERFPHRHIARLKKIDHILCKSQHAKEIFSTLHPSVRYIGFTSRDIYRDEVTADYNKFVHLAGRSTLKGTEVILELWKKHPNWPSLTLVQHRDNAPKEVPKNVRLIAQHLEHEALAEVTNGHGIHLCPSRSEGWGHYIVEGMSCEAVVITTDAAPMNELVDTTRGITIPSCRQEPRHLGMNFYIDPKFLEQEITKLIRESEAIKKQKGKRAREWFLENDLAFIESISTTFTHIL